MEVLTILAVVLICTALIAKYAGTEKGETDGENLVFQFSSLVRYLGPAALAIFVMLAIVASKRGQINDLFDYIEWVVLFVVQIAISLYLIQARVILTKDRIIKRTLAGETSLFFDDVKVIVVYPSSGNPAAAMARIRGYKTISYGALLSGYEQLLDETILRCKNASVLEKPA